MVALTLRSIAHVLGGDVCGREVLCPGPGHSSKDRSLGVSLANSTALGVVVRSYAGDDWRNCRDYVCERLGLANHRDAREASSPIERMQARKRQRLADEECVAEDVRRIAAARRTWDAATDPKGTVVETYLASRGLILPPATGDVIRFHPRLGWREGDEIIFVPAMVCAMRAIVGNDILAVHRTRLTEDGQKVDRRMSGPVAGTAIKIDPDENVTFGLTIGEGVETCLAAGQLGFSPVWAVASAGAIQNFPVLHGIDELTILEEADETSERSVQACGERWSDAGRTVRVARSRHGSDLNDALRARAVA